MQDMWYVIFLVSIGINSAMSSTIDLRLAHLRIQKSHESLRSDEN